jgi:hypothetical protein
MGLGNARLGYEFVDIAATIAGETLSGNATPRNRGAVRALQCRCFLHPDVVAYLFSGRHSAAMAAGQRPHLSEPNSARRWRLPPRQPVHWQALPASRRRRSLSQVYVRRIRGEVGSCHFSDVPGQPLLSAKRSPAFASIARAKSTAAYTSLAKSTAVHIPLDFHSVSPALRAGRNDIAEQNNNPIPRAP